MMHLIYRPAGLPGQFLQKENTHTDGESKFNLFFLSDIVFLAVRKQKKTSSTEKN